MSAAPLLEVPHGTLFGYGSGGRFTPVVTLVHFSLAGGDFLVLDGPNGCGKSTVLRGVLGLGALSRGTVRLRVPRSRIGFVPQEPPFDPQVPATAFDVVATAFPLAPPPREQIVQALRTVELHHRAAVRYALLSGGERRRVLLARALAHQARLLVLDEPTANVDAQTERLIEAVLTRRTRSQECAIMATSHSPTFAPHARRISLTPGGHHG